MYKEILRSIDNIAIFPATALAVFLVVFVGMVIWVWRFDKSFVQKMSNAPLEDD